MTELPYHHDISDCLTDEARGVRLQRHHLERLYDDLNKHIKTVADDDIAILDLPSRSDDLPAIAEQAERLRKNFDRIVLLGTGGSSLGSRALSEMSVASRKGLQAPQLDIITNIDPFYFQSFIETLPEKTAWVVVSKSGSTVETIMQFLTVLPKIKGKVSDRVVVVTESKNSPLGQLAELHKIPILPHDKDIGGRYSVLSVVGILPALIMGLSAEKLRAGAAMMVESLRSGVEAGEFAPAVGAALSYGLEVHNKISSQVMLAYSDRLGSLSRWHRQLWAESIGKEGRGTTPIYAMGPVDQHSQLQLWLEGPKDKLFTVMGAPLADGDKVDTEFLQGIKGVEYLQNCSLSDLMSASKLATAEILSEADLPVRRIDLQELSEYNIGALMMHFMLETILMARLMGVNPFDQPAVENCKIRIRDILQGNS